MKPNRIPFAIASTLLLAKACDDGGAGSNSTVSDSAGVQVVRSSAPAWTSETAWRIEAEPLLRIGEPAATPAEEFTRIGRVFSMSDGGVVVSNVSRPPDIRVFDATGRHLRTLGRSGGGPGEFRSLFNLWLVPPDTLIAFDPGESRLTTYLLDGTLIGTTPFEQRPIDGLGGVTGLPWGRFDDGSFLLRPNRFLPVGAEGTGRSEVAMLRVRADGAVADTIGVFPEADYVPRPAGGIMQPLFGRLAVQHVFGPHYYRGIGDSFTIDVYDATGTHLRRIDRAHTPRALTDELVERLKEHALEDAPPERREAITRDWADGPRAATLPAYGNRWVIALTGELWVQEFVTSVDTMNAWSVFDDDGRWLGSLSLPRGFTLHEAGEDYVLGVQRDELDVETVRRYRLVRRD